MPEMTHHQTCKKEAVASHKTHTRNKPDWNLFFLIMQSNQSLTTLKCLLIEVFRVSARIAVFNMKPAFLPISLNGQIGI